MRHLTAAQRGKDGGWHVSDDGYSLAVLCSEHNNRDQAIIALGLNRPAGDAWQS